jgi:hypothetical protein
VVAVATGGGWLCYLHAEEGGAAIGGACLPARRRRLVLCSAPLFLAL